LPDGTSQKAIKSYPQILGEAKVREIDNRKNLCKYFLPDNEEEKIPAR